ncbi:MAG: 30S ribosomal protein S4 [Candidatus Paceibacterota bacterium]
MITGPKYKIAKRLGAPIFEKTQTAKFALSKSRGEKKGGRRKPMSEFKKQLFEKQKMRFTYGLREKQFYNYVVDAISAKNIKTTDRLFENVERRVDNVVYRLGFAQTRALARQMVSHGHITLNGKKITIPSASVKEGDIISIRENSKKKTLFATVSEKTKSYTPPNWLVLDSEKLTGVVKGIPKPGVGELLFDMDAVLQFYSR